MIDDDWDKTFEFIKEHAWNFTEAYKQILTRRITSKYTEEQMLWKQVRRGRYVEFNLLFDAGTKFGLETPDCRIESILMSLPLNAKWVNYKE